MRKKKKSKILTNHQHPNSPAAWCPTTTRNSFDDDTETSIHADLSVQQYQKVWSAISSLDNSCGARLGSISLGEKEGAYENCLVWLCCFVGFGPKSAKPQKIHVDIRNAVDSIRRTVNGGFEARAVSWEVDVVVNMLEYVRLRVKEESENPVKSINTYKGELGSYICLNCGHNFMYSQEEGRDLENFLPK